MAIQKIKRMPVFVAMIILLFIAGISFASHFKAFKLSGANVAFADDDERDSEENEEKEEEDDKDEEEEKDEEKEEVEEDENEENRSAITGQRNFTSEKEEDGDENEADEIDDETDDNDAAEEIAELNKDIKKIENKIGALEAVGNDVSAIKAALDEIKAMASDAENKFKRGDLAGAEATAEGADDRLESVEHSMGVLLGDKDDEEEDEDDDAEEVAKKYRNAVAQFVHELQELEGRDGGLGQQVRIVAQAQNQNKDNVSALIGDIDSRGKALRLIFGPDYKSLDKINKQIETNQSSIQSLNTVLAQVQDAYVKTILQAQIKVLQQENERLQNFVQGVQDQPSVFGWFMRLLQ